MAHSDMNTEAKTIKMSSMNHTEGGWPEHVRTEMVEHKNKFIRFDMESASLLIFNYSYTGKLVRRICSNGQ